MSFVKYARNIVGPFAVLGLLGLFLVACSSGEAGTPAKPSVKAVPTATATMISVPSVVDTPTPTSTKAAYPDPSIKRGGSLIRAHYNTLTFDPTGSSSYRDLMYVEQFYSSLLQNRIGTELECDLCESWTIEDDGKTHVFKLHAGATFSDGTPLTTKDVIYSLNKIAGKIEGEVQSYRCAPMGLYLDPDNPYEAVDDTTLKIHTKYASSAFAKFLGMGYCGIIKDGTKKADLKNKPNGSGAFIMGDWDVGSQMTFEANPNYFRAGLPYLDTFVVPVISRTAQKPAVLTGRIDKSHILSASPDSWAEFEAFEKEGKGIWHKEPCLCIWGATLNVTAPPFNDIRLRRAVNLAMDRSSHHATATLGRPLMSLYQQAWWPAARQPEEIWNKYPGWGTGANKEAERAAAAQLIKDAGYPDGLKIRVLGVIAQEWLGSQLSKVGFDVQLEPADYTTQATRVNNREYDIFSWAWISGYSEPDVWIGTFFKTGGGSNNSGYSDPYVDQMFDTISREKDPVLRNMLIREVEDYILEAMPLAPTSDKFFDFIQWDHYKGYQNGLGESFHDASVWLYDGRVQ